MMPAYIPIEVVDSSDPDGLFQEVTAKTEQAQATITLAGDITYNDFKGPLLAASHPKVRVREYFHQSVCHLVVLDASQGLDTASVFPCPWREQQEITEGGNSQFSI